MNSYPAELLHHHYACMVVAGLTAAAVDEHPTAVFPELTQSLHDILAARGRNVVWDPARGQSAVFHTVFAPSHTTRLPPHKTKPSARHVAAAIPETDAVPPQVTAAFAALPPRSPLSPLHPNSALFPDGLIAPIWVRKHTELIPAVFVAFYTLRPSSDAESDAEALRKADQDLIQTIAERKRTLTERGIKLTVVLLTQREMLQDAQLEARLSFLRRSSGLDSRASLFVLTPVSRAELGEFVTSLHSALFESAVDYYREHARRVKRKRARYPPPQSTLAPITNALAALSPAAPLHWLSREGWIVRSEYKLAVFAELQGDNTEALLRYKEAYDLLCMSPSCLLGSTLMLPPRSKRWAEAKVLADTIVIKICKLHLYNDDGPAVLPVFRRHLARFTDLSTGWGIGTMTFEYWSWLAKQYRMLAELVEHATKVVPGSPLPPFELLQHAPPLPAKLLHPEALAMFSTPESSAKGSTLPPLPVGMLTPNQNAVASSILPQSTLQGPGAYFYLAALCTIERRTRYQRALELAASVDGPLAHEHKFDHTAQIVDHLTRAYDAYKRAHLDRTALLIAARLASTYHDAHQHAMALKFLERIMQSYAREAGGDGAVKAALVGMAADCAVQCGDVPAALRIVLPLVASTASESPALHALQTLLLQPPETTDPLPPVKLSYGPTSSEVFELQAVFPRAEAECGSPVPFQLRIRNTSSVDLGFLALRKITLHFQGADAFPPIEIVCTDAGKATSVVDLGTLHASNGSPTSIEADAAVWRPSAHIAFQGTVVPKTAGPVEISKVVLSTVDETPSRPALELEFTLTPPEPEAAETAFDALRGGEWLLARGELVTVTQRAAAGVTLVVPRSYAVSITGPAAEGACYYVDQRIALVLTVRNDEASDAVECWVDAGLQPTYEGASDDRLSLDPSAAAADPDDSTRTQQQAVHDLATGVVQPGHTREVTLWFVPARKPGLRTLDLTLHTRRHTADSDDAMHVVKQSVPLDVTAPFEAVVRTRPAQDEREPGTRLTAELFGAGTVAKSATLVDTQVSMVGRASVHVLAVRGTTASLQPAGSVGDVTGVWETGDRFSLRHVWDAAADEQPALELVWTTAPSAVENVTRIALPALDTPTGVTITLAHARRMTLHQASELTLGVANRAARAVRVDITLDSTENFAFAGARRLTLPHVLPLFARDAPRASCARVVPLKIGLLRLPAVSFRVSVAEQDAAVQVSTSGAVSPNTLPEGVGVTLVHAVTDPATGRTLSSTTLYPSSQPHPPLSVHVHPL